MPTERSSLGELKSWWFSSGVVASPIAILTVMREKSKMVVSFKSKDTGLPRYKLPQRKMTMGREEEKNCIPGTGVRQRQAVAPNLSPVSQGIFGGLDRLTRWGEFGENDAHHPPHLPLFYLRSARSIKILSDALGSFEMAPTPPSHLLLRSVPVLRAKCTVWQQILTAQLRLHSKGECWGSASV